MQNFGSTGRTKSGCAAQVLIWGGILLLVAGGLLTFPYVKSRMATFAPTATPTLSSQRSATLLPTHTPSPLPIHTRTPLPTHTLASSDPIPTHTATPHPPSQPDRIVIPSLNVDGLIIPISWHTIDVNGQQQAVWDVPDMDAAGWHETSAPLGVPGNTVINGHNTTHGEIFRDLYTMEAGDDIVLYAGETVRTFAVTEVLILPEAGQPLEVRLENARYILPTEDERLTIVTCHPYGSLQYRLIVIAQPVGNAN